jgi:hypothetical protein
MYQDDYDDVHPDLLNHFYGVCCQERNTHQNDANPIENDKDSDLEELVHHIASGQEQHIRHDPFDLPDAHSPFTSANVQEVFKETLAQVCQAGYIPAGLGVREDEWEDVTYPGFEILKVGRMKDIVISFPMSMWLSHAVLFAQALEVLSRTLAVIVDNDF